jgi:predicted negative regulator of RcsB-dependent stress response
VNSIGINPHDAVYEALRALGDHLAETDQQQEASEVYQNLLNKIMQSNPDPQNNLAHAVAFSQIFGSLAVSHRRSGQRDRGEAFAALRLQLWRHWDRKFPDNNLIRRQIASASTH